MTTRAQSEHHTVTVMVEYLDADDPDDVEVTVEFTCTAPADADCRTYPASCGCEYFTTDPDNPGFDAEGHEYEPGQKCWVQDWFEAGDETACYTGEDLDEFNPHYVPTTAQTGHIDVTFADDDIEWDWAERPHPLEPIRPVLAVPPEPEPEPDPRWEQTGPDLIDALNGDDDYRHTDCDNDDQQPSIAREVCDRCWLEKSLSGECGCEP